MSQLPLLPTIVGDPPIGDPHYDEYHKSLLLRWNLIAGDLNRLTHSLAGPQNGPPLSARAFAIFHLAIHDAYFTILPYDGTKFTYFIPYLPSKELPDPPPPLVDVTTPPEIRQAGAKEAVVGAAMTVLKKLYTAPAKLERNVSQRTLRLLAEHLDTAFNSYITENPDISVQSPAFDFGSLVGTAMLASLEVKASEIGTDQGLYKPPVGPYFFDDEPTNPIRPTLVDPNDPLGAAGITFPAHVYHAPFYGTTAKRLATQYDHPIADPPIIPSTATTGAVHLDDNEYKDAFEDVHRMGGAADLSSTFRRPDQTTAGHFWAYDGANLIGTPPRHYNQILRHIAFANVKTGDVTDTTNIAEQIRLFALANAAMADAGILCWKEKYHYQLWRPLSGVRQDPSGPVRFYPKDDDFPTGAGDYPVGQQRPFWITLGAPETNSNKIPFKPPFPSYPSGHATFGGAFFQMVRLFYKKRDSLDFGEHDADTLGFRWVSDEMDGVSRDLYNAYVPTLQLADQPGVVRTKVERRFESCWEAMVENAMSRVWLGVHWRFDAFAASDVFAEGKTKGEAPYATNTDGSSRYQDFKKIKLVDSFDGKRDGVSGFPVGGVPLGICIADDIWKSGLKQAADEVQPEGVKYELKLKRLAQGGPASLSSTSTSESAKEL